MSLKEELQLWSAALDAYDVGDYGMSLDIFSILEPNSRILTNMGLMFATVGEHEKAVDAFIRATKLDHYLAVAYFQCGVSNFLIGRYEFALKDFEDALLHLRGNQEIRYEQLGLKFVLYFAEVLFNKGLTLIYFGRTVEGMSFLEKAKAAKATVEHDVIDEAIEYQGDQFTVFSIPVGVIYRPSENKLRNAQTKNYLGKPKLVAASEEIEAFTEFTGASRMKKGVSPNGLFLTGSDTNLSIRSQNTDVSQSRALIRSQPQLVRSPSDPVPGSEVQRSRSYSELSVSKASGRTLSRKKIAKAKSQAKDTEWDAKARITAPDREEPKSATKDAVDSRQLEYYYEYFDSYNTDSPSPLTSGRASPVDRNARSNPERQLTWPKRNSKAVAYKGSQRSAPVTTTRPGYTSRHASLRRGSSRRGFRSARTYDMGREEEEGYASWGDDSTPETQKIRVKLHYQNDIRGMALWPDTPYAEFVRNVTKKFSSVNGLGLKFKDEDGEIISLKDESDYDLAIETASPRESPTGVMESKLEIWCVDL